MNPSTSVTGKRPREEEVATNGKGSENGNAEAKVSKIEENTTPHQQLSVAVTTSPSLDGEKKIVRVWADGCFDMMHFGHANALRQARSLGDYLVVGVHSDAEITKNKGPPVMNEEERYTAVEACKWVDEIVRDAPYTTQLDVLNRYNIDFCVHGDDITTAGDGTDCYAQVKEAGRYKEVPRTTGVSTTDLVTRMLECTKHHHTKGELDHSDPLVHSMREEKKSRTGVSKWISSGKLNLFSDGKTALPTDKVVYVDGAFDLFHVGHIKVLERAKQLGTFLLVGVLDDETVNRYKKGNFPIMTLYERVLGVLSCKYVDEVVLGAPEKLTEEFIKNNNISVVVHGKDQVEPCADGTSPYEVAEKMGIYHELDSESPMTTTLIIERIAENRRMYEERNARKEKKAQAERELEEERKKAEEAAAATTSTA